MNQYQIIRQTEWDNGNLQTAGDYTDQGQNCLIFQELYWMTKEEYKRPLNVIPKLLIQTHNTHIYQLGIVLCKLGKFDEAFKDYAKAIEINPQEAEFYFNRGLSLLYGYRSFEQAIQEFSNAILLDQQFFQAYINRGQFRFLFYSQSFQLFREKKRSH
ncbi:hypothetical protein pb186bvf_016632 [Paramecium bursaria]